MQNIPIIFLGFSCIFYGCRNHQSGHMRQNENAIQTTQSELTTDAKLLLGEWNSSDEKTISIRFTPSCYYEIDNGKISDSSKYTFSNVSCEAEKQVEENVEYLSILATDGTVSFCYSVQALTDSSLSLMYLNGNGSISSYVRKRK